MKFVLFFTMMLVTFNVFGQYADISHDERTLTLGVNSVARDTSVSATAIAPYEKDIYSGWIGAHINQVTTGDSVTSQYVNARVEGAITFESISANLFYDATRDKVQGIAFQSEVGYFIANDFGSVSVGAGNFVQDTSAREDLGLIETDPVSVRWLAYAKTNLYGISVLARVTPEIGFADFQATLEPTYVFNLKEDISLSLKAIVEYDSDPLGEADRVNTSTQLLATIRI